MAIIKSILDTDLISLPPATPTRNSSLACSEFEFVDRSGGDYPGFDRLLVRSWIIWHNSRSPVRRLFVKTDAYLPPTYIDF